jgi:hypothetical protein
VITYALDVPYWQEPSAIVLVLDFEGGCYVRSARNYPRVGLKGTSYALGAAFSRTTTRTRTIALGFCHTLLAIGYSRSARYPAL